MLLRSTHDRKTLCQQTLLQLRFRSIKMAQLLKEKLSNNHTTVCVGSTNLMFPGYNIGTRLIEDFLAKSSLGRSLGWCSDFSEVGEVVAKVIESVFQPSRSNSISRLASVRLRRSSTLSRVRHRDNCLLIFSEENEGRDSASVVYTSLLL